MFDISVKANSDSLESMYQEVILDAARNPHGKTHFDITNALEQAEPQETQEPQETDAKNSTEFKEQQTLKSEIKLNNTHESCNIKGHTQSKQSLGQSHQFNPTCGDEVTMRVTLSYENANEQNPIISSIKWDGHGCSISQASLSMMVDLVEGKSVDEALKLAKLFHCLMQSKGAGLRDEDEENALEDAIVLQGVSRYPMRIKCALLAWEGLKDSIAKAMQDL